MLNQGILWVQRQAKLHPAEVLGRGIEVELAGPRLTRILRDAKP